MGRNPITGTRTMRLIACLIAILTIGQCLGAGAADARSRHARHAHRVEASGGDIPRDANPRQTSTAGGCLSQGPADRLPCDPWYFKRTDPNIAGGFGN